MGTIIQTNELVLLTFAQALLTDAGIGCFLADLNLAVADGSIGAIRARLLVADGDEARARALLTEAGLGQELVETHL